ncbi:Cell division cycle and apoptosis regulator protein 1 [Gryllus bimaculatus]|nr:Cell division cycle and apoptosis regulator protein 1 [Gryllus bimaculatus]
MLAESSDEASSTSHKEFWEEECTQEVKREPTHYSELDPKGMKSLLYDVSMSSVQVNELRQELEARTLSPKGLKSQLIARLTKAIKTEAEKAEEEKEDKKSSDPDPPPKAEVDTKDDEKKKKEEEEKKKQDERERIAREKKYTLPEVPHIIVHPSRTAKSGKFDCTVMSLSLLLDYRPEDTKEHSFEVSLFAELFNEMLMRDFGFNIFRALYVAPERPKEDEKVNIVLKDKKDEKDKKDDKEKKDDKDRKDDKKNGKKDEDKDDKKDDKHSKERKDDKTKADDKNEEKDEEDDEEEEDEEDEDSKDGKRDKDRDEKDKKRDKDKDKKKKEKIKLYTEDKQLLLSFIYFDQSHCGYIFDKDIEELLYTLGLNLSRAQVRKLVQKVVTRDSLHYRKLTDKRIKSEDIKDTDKEKDRSKDGEKDEKISDDADDMLSFGNRHLLPVFFSLSDDGCSPSKRIRKSPVQDKDKDKDNKDREKHSLPEGFVMYKGALLDVQKLMDQLKRSEKARVDTENKMIAMKQDLGEVKESAKQSANTVKDLSGELREYKERLHDTDIELSKVKARSETYLLTLREVQEKVVPVLSSVPAFRNEVEDIQLCREDEKKTTEIRANVKKEVADVHEFNSSKVDEQNSGEKETKTSKLSKADSDDCSSSSVVKHETKDKDNV